MKYRKGWVYENETQELDALIQTINELPIMSVLKSYGVKPELKRGNRILALCPFHMDNHIGSFIINPERNSCYCFACENGGGVIKSVAKMLGKTYAEAALQIACDQKLITEKKFKELSGVEYEVKAHATDGSDEDIVVKEPEEKTDEKKLMYHEVYTAFKEVSTLSEEHLAKLTGKRHLSDERIKADYFTISSSVKNTIRLMKRKLGDKYSDEQISKIPGFYMENLGKDKWELSYMPFKGLGILLRDEKGLAQAIQVRLDGAKDKASRYIFMSGRYEGSGVMKNGGNIGTVIDYRPANKESSRFAITEGRFKAEILSQNGFNTFSVQGVNNYKGIVPMFKRIVNTKGTEPKVCIFYDADLIKNPQVAAALIKLIKYLKTGIKGITVSVILWDCDLGKGIDDLIFAGNKHSCISYEAQEFIKASENTLVDAVAAAGYDGNQPANKFTKEDRDIILSMFETLMRTRLGLSKEAKTTTE